MANEKKQPLNEDEKRKIFRDCDCFLNHHYRKPVQRMFFEAADSCRPDELPDSYGSGLVIEDFEKDIAKVLGKDVAVFMPSGTMAQPIALRIWCDKEKKKTFGLHHTSHLELHEQHAYRHLHGLRGCLLGEKQRGLSLADLEACKEDLAAVILELPHRELGGSLPVWAEVVAMSEWCRKKKVHFHLDGARLWECGPFYGKSYKEICSLFDSVYVSFYKGLGGVAGAMLAGPKWFVDEARIWQRRQGGNLVSLYPYVVTARAAFALRLSRMKTYHEKAVELAEVLATIPGLEVTPARPQTNMMHLRVKADPDKLEEAFLQIALEEKVALFPRVGRQDDGFVKLELVVGDATLDLSTADISRWMKGAVAHAAFAR